MHLVLVFVDYYTKAMSRGTSRTNENSSSLRPSNKKLKSGKKSSITLLDYIARIKDLAADNCTALNDGLRCLIRESIDTVDAMTTKRLCFDITPTFP